MSIMRATLLTVASVTLLGIGFAKPAGADDAEVVIAYVNEFTPVHVWEDPAGCNALPFGTHVIFNETDRPVRIFVDPFCMVPLAPMSWVKPGYSTHVSAVGSFRAGA